MVVIVLKADLELQWPQVLGLEQAGNRTQLSWDIHEAEE